MYGTIELDIREARNLAKADLIGLSDPYAVVQSTAGSVRYKTKTIKNTLNPTWNERYSHCTRWAWTLSGAARPSRCTRMASSS